MSETLKVDFQKKNGILTGSPKIIKMVRDKFSIKNPSYLGRRYAPRLYTVTPSGAFQVGLWSEIEGYIRSLNLPVKIEITNEFKNQFNPNCEIKNISKIENFTYYDYQEDAIKQLIEHGRGIALIATGGGKSILQAGLVKTFLDHFPDYKILMTVPNISLLNQLYYSFLNEYGIDNISRWGDNNLPDLSKNVLIANNQILISNIEETLKIVKDFDVVIVDEVHTINEKKNKISKVIHNITTPIKFGLTGTLPDSILGSWNVLGKIGPIVYERNSYELRKQEAITDVEIKIIICKHSKKPVFSKSVTSPTDAYNAELDYIINHAERNAVITKICKSLKGNILIVVDRLNYIDSLKTALVDSDKEILVVTGDTSTDDRTFIQEKMENQSGLICLAMSKCFSTGISIKNLHYAIFACMGKGGVKTIQTIGRTVRKHSSKNKAIIFDIADDLVYSARHLKERVQIYKDQKIDYKFTKINL